MPLRSPIVLVEGTALAGWQIRAYSRDVEIYMPGISADAVELVEQELRARRGASFRLDVTTGENVWGPCSEGSPISSSGRFASRTCSC